MLATLDVERRPGRFGYVSVVAGTPAPAGAQAVVAEGATTAYVVALAPGDEPDFVGAWLTLTMHSSLEAVGLTATVAATLAGQGIPANVLAGWLHDHVLVPADRADEAVAAVRALRDA